MEAAYINHFRLVRRLIAFGVLAWLFLPFLVLPPFKLLAARVANRRMNDYFQEHGIGWGPIRPGTTLAGFVFTSLDEGTKQFSVKLLGLAGVKDFAFSIAVPGLKVDHRSKRLDELGSSGEPVECDEQELPQAARSPAKEHRQSARDPSGRPSQFSGDRRLRRRHRRLRRSLGRNRDDQPGVLLADLQSLFARQRVPLFPRKRALRGRTLPGLRLQKTRETIDARLHLRLWITSLRFQGKPVWIGQISRDIGVRFTLKTWNLTTHKIDPDVDDAQRLPAR